MAKIIHTHLTDPKSYTQWELDMVYNGIDCLATRMVHDAQIEQLGPETSKTYDFSRALQGPVLEMNLRGVLVDQHRKAEVIEEFYEKIDFLERNLSRIVLEGVGMAGFNPRSPKDLQALFYDRLGIPPITFKGRVTVDRGAREKLATYMIARPIVAHLNAIADLAKKINVLKTEVDGDGRIRTTYNIAATDTGRFSSSLSAFGTGGNLQNIEESLRSVFIADMGYKFAKFDAKSGESFIVGAIEWNLFGDSKYLDACDSGDPHTATAKLCWPAMQWTGDLKKDKAIADNKDAPFYRHHTHRQVTKKLGHASNYGGMPDTISTQTGMPRELVAAFQPIYFTVYPSHREWHQWVASQIATRGFLTNLTGRKRWFMGRRTDPDTVRAAIAYDPQGSLADIVNTALLRIWRLGYVTICLQDHDAITFMYPEEMEDGLIPQIMSDLIVRIPLKHDRELAIPYDAKVGWNRGDYDSKKNPDGLKDYNGTDKRQRTPTLGILDRPITRAAKRAT